MDKDILGKSIVGNKDKIKIDERSINILIDIDRIGRYNNRKDSGL